MTVTDDTRAGETPEEENPEANPLAKLTPREFEVAVLVAQGLTNREIANRLVLSKRTVDSHVENMFPKLMVNSRVQVGNLLAGHPMVTDRAPLKPPLDRWVREFRDARPELHLVDRLMLTRAAEIIAARADTPGQPVKPQQ